MTTAADHVREAEDYLDDANQLQLGAFDSAADYTSERMALIAMAQVHATLASAPTEALEQAHVIKRAF